MMFLSVQPRNFKLSAKSWLLYMHYNPHNAYLFKLTNTLGNTINLNILLVRIKVYLIIVLNRSNSLSVESAGDSNDIAPEIRQVLKTRSL